MTNPPSLTALLVAFGGLISAATLPAQADPKPVPRPAQFLPTDYHNVLFADFAQLRESGVLDELRVGAGGMMLQQLEQGMGLELDSLQSITMVPVAPPGSEDVRMGRTMTVMVLEGVTELDPPRMVGGYTDDKIGAFDVKRSDSSWKNEVFVQPSPKVQVIGETDLVRPVLEGKLGSGQSCPDILSLLSTRRAGLLCYATIHLADRALNRHMVDSLFGDEEWPENGQPQYMFLDIRAIGDPDDPNVQVEVVFRHLRGGENVDLTQKHFDALLAKAKEIPQMRMLMPLLQKIQRSRDKSDLVYQLDLGRGRAAAGNLAMALAPLMFMGASAEPAPVVVEAVEAEAVVEEEPAPEPAKKKGGGGNTKGNGR